MRRWWSCTPAPTPTRPPPPRVNRELRRQGLAAAHAGALGLQVNAGHGLHYFNVREYIEDVPHLHTLNIGHAIVSRAILVGLDLAVAEMLSLLRAPETALTAD